VGEAFGFKVDFSHSTDQFEPGTYPGGCKDGQGPDVSGGAGGMTVNVPNNGRLLRNLGMAANTVMSHILHFYHLVALDYVDVNSTGLIPKGFFCPNYDSNYYARGIDPILQTGGLGAPAYTVNNAPVANPGIPAAALGDLTPYFAGQYVRALKFRRLAHQIGALFTGKMPQASCYTPAGMTTKAYDPSPAGSNPDSAVVDKFHEIMYGGPAFNATTVDGSTSGATHPLNLSPISVTNPHPESLLGFIGKPKDFWVWAAGGFAPADLPVWAVAGVPTAGTAWKENTGTYMFDTVAAAHVFPEYFWFGSGYGRTLAWGIFEGAAKAGVNPETQDCLLNYQDQRLITRGRTIVPRVLNGSGTPYSFTHLPARHLDAAEFTANSAYIDSKALTGRHMWKGKTKAEAMNDSGSFPPGTPGNAGAYSYAKSPRYDSLGNGNPADFVPYEVGPYARMMSNAGVISGGPATAGQVLAVDAGTVGLYYPGVLKDVDVTLEGVLGIPSILPGNGIGVFPGWGANLTAHLTFLQTAVPGSPVFYLPPGAVSPLAFSNGFAYDYYGDATLDRIACRTLETYYVARQMVNWFASLTPGVNSNQTLDFDWGGGKLHPQPKFGASGAGLTEAPRGALGHWIKIGKAKKNKNFKKFKGKVSNYQIITPTTWNINPKDHLGAPGPAEQCMLDTPLVNPAEPIECLRVYHSFDFCCACTVHVLKKKKEVAKVTMEALP
jgi:Ni,Fe-hydrogenase I large subunit